MLVRDALFQLPFLSFLIEIEFSQKSKVCQIRGCTLACYVCSMYMLCM